MKIRIRGNSLRLRLTQSEVKAFETAKIVSSSIAFPSGTVLTYELCTPGDNEWKAEFSDNVIRVCVPNDVARKWLHPDEVGMETYLNLPEGDRLRVLIEKDFACLTERKDEDESDNFPNPMANC
ncbi:MAG: hypothetical protein Kow0075_06980 [Salibacteraceae bacterium]